MSIDLLEGIEELVKREKVQTGVILSAVGALKKATFRNLKVLPPDLKVEKHQRLYLDLLSERVRRRLVVTPQMFVERYYGKP